MPGIFLYRPNPPDVVGAVTPVASEVISLLLVRILQQSHIYIFLRINPSFDAPEHYHPHHFLYWLLCRTFYFPDSVFTPYPIFFFSLHSLYFWLKLVVVNPCIFKKICFCIHKTHSSVNFIWFAHFSHQIFYDRPLFKPGTLWFTAILNSHNTNIFAKWK